ncbi:MAG TPA: hypothetical protein VN688_33755 [Gemmataceae bacterium]|nr:hypothetical protein [Gemmataceae bacterium]
MPPLEKLFPFRQTAVEGRAVEWSRVYWGQSPRVLLQAAREISKNLGHYEIICPLHLLLGLLVNARPSALAVAEPEWDRVRAIMEEFAPPWDDGLVVLSPGGQTPTTKRVLGQATMLAQEAREAVEVKHIWAAINIVEMELVQAVLSRLGLATETSHFTPGTSFDDDAPAIR